MKEERMREKRENNVKRDRKERRESVTEKEREIMGGRRKMWETLM